MESINIMIQGDVVTREMLATSKTAYIASKPIAKITVCGALQVIVTDTTNWIPPTEEQRKNLKDMFCIDVEIF